MKRSCLITAIVLLCMSLSAYAQKDERGVAKIGKNATAVVEKGTWMIGGNVSFTDYNSSEYALAIIKGINVNGINFKISPTVLYCFAKNWAVGGRLSYNRSYFNLADASIEAMGVSLGIKDYNRIHQKGGIEALGRYYMPLGQSGRFALAGTLYAGAYYGQSKVTSDQDGVIIGTYQTKLDLGIGVEGGFVAFFTKNFALEGGLNIFNTGLSNTQQKKNQVSEGSRNSWNAYYMLNLLSLNLGAYFYF